MQRSKRIVMICLCCVLMCSMMTGCKSSGKGKSGNGNSQKSVCANILNGSLSLSKVNFYDFYNNKNQTSYSGKGTALSNTITSKEIYFYGQDNVLRVICVDKELSTKPSTVKLYTNSAKTKYDTYACSY